MNWKILLAIAGVAGVAALVARGVESEEDEETEDIREKARDYFEVIGDCDAVEFKGTAGQAADFWAGIGRPYIEAKIDEAMTLGTSEPRAVTIFILNDLVPGCTWPPEGTAMDNPSQHLLWATVGQMVDGYLMGPGFEEEEDPGPSFKEPEPAKAAIKDQ